MDEVSDQVIKVGCSVSDGFDLAALLFSPGWGGCSWWRGLGDVGIVEVSGSEIYVEAGESREEWDLAFIDKRATLGEDGEVTWRG